MERRGCFYVGRAAVRKVVDLDRLDMDNGTATKYIDNEPTGEVRIDWLAPGGRPLYVSVDTFEKMKAHYYKNKEMTKL